eukprot:CAMPEP_0167761732 /NCGR_PEP_ID=MMETSP0110_2-20121227/12344_1 /TAXON_ID=629695 /ORGANISM="Gymnochlora sp., Strain CCMP2014" /LENGTH=344 /DNA_ID=CAMNT_0007648465 /DNA_START=85 /DNA_END=1116 /DNA_ORIENTATION=-
MLSEPTIHLITPPELHSQIDYQLISSPSSVETSPSSANFVSIANRKRKRSIDGKSSSRSSTKPVLVIEAGTLESPSSVGVIPGSIYLNAHKLEMWPSDAECVDGQLPVGSGNLKPWVDLKGVLDSMGISNDYRIVVYFRDHEKKNQLIAAARTIWALAVAGIEDLSMLDGGMQAWREAKLPITSKHRSIHGKEELFANDKELKRKDLILVRRSGPDFEATTEDIEAIVEGKVSGHLADVRSWKEYMGIHHDYTFFSNLGRIPKSRWATWGPSTYVGGDFWEGRLGNMKSLKEIEKTWAKHGIVKPKNVNERVIFYCGSGWRSSLAWVLAKLMGWSHVSNYDGGW